MRHATARECSRGDHLGHARLIDDSIAIVMPIDRDC